MGSFQAYLTQQSLRQPLTVKVKKTGRMKGPDLSDPALKQIGDEMLKAQFRRWDDGLNANGSQAKKLSFKYFKEKQKYTGQTSPIRDMKMTGETIKNFTLRRASQGQIRAENTSRVCRGKAQRAQKAEEMIGFAGSDQIAVFRATQLQYGIHLQKAWIPIG
jgi:hypothetical protein